MNHEMQREIEAFHAEHARLRASDPEWWDFMDALLAAYETEVLVANVSRAFVAYLIETIAAGAEHNGR